MANAQAGVNKDAAITQANLNRINQVTPQGSLSYSVNGYNSDGTPQYTQTQTLSPGEQQKYDLNNQVATALDGLANSNISRVAGAQATPFTYDGMTPITSNVNGGNVQTSLDYSGLTKLPSSTQDFADQAKQAQDAVYKQAASRLDPQWQNNDNDFKAQMAAQGISENSDAYRRAQTAEANAKNDAYNQATYSSIAAGNQQQQNLFGEDLSARQQGQNEVNTQGTFNNTALGQIFGQGQSNAALGNSARQQQIEQSAYLRNMPLNDIATLLGTGGGVTSPNFNPVSQVGVAAPDYSGLVQNQYNAKMQQYQQQQQAQSSMLGSIFGAAGTAAMAFSDRRLKENIKRIGTLANGLATYAFTYIGDRAQQFGVMAQEVLHVKPDAVEYAPNGYMLVDYGKVY